MKSSIMKGFAFGLTSSTITTLGMMIGLYSGTGSRLAVIGAILSIALADSMSDALAIHISEESQKKNSLKDVWTATVSTLIAKFLFALTFLIPVLILELSTAIIVSGIWGLSILAILSYFIAKEQKEKPASVIFEHVGIMILVIILTHFLGLAVARIFG